MTEQRFPEGGNAVSISYLFDRAMEAFKRNAGMLIVATIIYFVVLGVVNSISWGLANLVLYGPLTAGYTWFALKTVRNEEPDLANLFSGFQRQPAQAIIIGLLLTVFYIIGFALCILPGLFVTLIYMLAFPYIVDKQLPAWDAMEASRAAVSRDWGGWIVVLLVVAAINLVGAILCGIGLLVTLPFTTLMIVAAYDALEPAGAPAEPFEEV